MEKIYNNHEELLNSLKVNSSENKKVIDSYENMCVTYAIMAGMVGLEAIILMNSGQGLAVLGGLVKFVIQLVLTLITVGSIAKFIVGRRYYNYLKENNIKILSDIGNQKKV